MSGGEGMRWIIGRGSKGVVPRIARCFAVGLRCVVSRCDGVSAEAGSRPGCRGTFFVRTKKVPKESRPASTLHGRLCTACRLQRREAVLRETPLTPLCCSKHRVAAQLALAAFGARTVLGPAVLLGVSEGEIKASPFLRCRNSVVWMQAEGRNPGDAVEDWDAPVLDFASLHPGYEHHPSAEIEMVWTFGSRRERRVAERDREEGRGLSELRAQRGRVPQAPGRASNAGKSGATHLTANAGSPFLGYFFWRSKRSNTPAGGGTPANVPLCRDSEHRKPHSVAQFVGPRNAQRCVARIARRTELRRPADREICRRLAIHTRTPPQRRHPNFIGGDECSTRS